MRILKVFSAVAVTIWMGFETIVKVLKHEVENDPRLKGGEAEKQVDLGKNVLDERQGDDSPKSE